MTYRRLVLERARPAHEHYRVTKQNHNVSCILYRPQRLRNQTDDQGAPKQAGYFSLLSLPAYPGAQGQAWAQWPGLQHLRQTPFALQPHRQGKGRRKARRARPRLLQPSAPTTPAGRGRTDPSKVKNCADMSSRTVCCSCSPSLRQTASQQDFKRGSSTKLIRSASVVARPRPLFSTCFTNTVSTSLTCGWSVEAETSFLRPSQVYRHRISWAGSSNAACRIAKSLMVRPTNS